MPQELKYANENIKLLLKYKGWTQATLCKKTGISVVTLRRRLNSKELNWTMSEAICVAKALGESVSDIFFTRMIPKCNKNKELEEKGA